MKALTERLYPYILAILAPLVVCLLWFFELSPQSVQLAQIFDKVTGLGGIIVGFLATALAILFTLPDGPAVRFLRRNKGLSQMVAYLEAAIGWWLLVTLISILMLLFLPDIRRNGWLGWAGLLWSYIVGVSILLFYRAARLIGSLLRSLAQSRI